MEDKRTPFALFHVIEHGEEAYFRVNRPLELLDAAAGTCAHDTLKRNAPRLRFRDYYAGAEPCLKNDFDCAVSERLENAGIVAGAFEIGFDRNEFSALHIMDGWKTFRMEDVRKATERVAEADGMNREELYCVC